LWASESICYEGRSATTRFVQTDESLRYPITLLGVTNDEFVLEGAMDNLREVVKGGIGAPGVLVEDVLVTEDHIERTTTEHIAREG
jgi:hypothetical protein